MKRLMLFMLGAMFSGSLFLTTPALADQSGIISDPACNNLKSNANPIAGCNGTNNKGLGENGGYLTTLIDAFIYVAGFLAFLFLIIGGIRYLTSTGDPKRIQQAKDTVIYSLAGLVVVILARLIVGYIIANV
jgi:hypothetical protein